MIVKEREISGYPEVTGIVINRKGLSAVINFVFIENLGYGEITLKKSDCWKEHYELADDEFMLARDVLDQQIFDVEGVRVVRVNDIELAKIEEKFALISVDISNRALLRRLGLVGLPILRKTKSKFIDWGNLSVVKGSLGNLKLKISKAKLVKLHPADIANLIENLNFNESIKLVQSLDKETAAEVLEEVEPEYKDTLLERISPKELAHIMEEMPSAQAADVIKDLSEHKKRLVFRKLGVRKAMTLHKLSKYGNDVAGGIMNPEFMSVNKDATVGQAISKIRKHSDEHSSIYHVFVVDEGKRLEGVVSVRTLLLANSSQKVNEIMGKVIRTVRVRTHIQEVARVMTKYNLMSIAVVDKNKVIQGLITVDDILRFLIPNA